MTTWLRVLAVVVGGLWLAALVPPYGLHALHWAAYLPMFWALREDTPRANRWLLLLYGTVAEAAIFRWIAQTITLFSNIPGPVATAILLLFAVVYGLPYLVTFSMLHPLRRRIGSWWILALPAWLVIVEWISSIVILFPYQQGISQFRAPPTWQLASVTGVWGLSFLVLFFNAAFGEWIYRRREGRPAPWGWMGAAVATLGLVVVFGLWRHDRVERMLADAPVTRVLQVQTDKDMLWRLSHGAADSFEFWLDSTRELERGEVDLIVWPEGAVPYQLNTSSAGMILWDVVRDLDADLVVGAGTREREPDPAMGESRVRMFNSVYVFDRAALALPDDAAPLSVEAQAVMDAGCDLTAARLRTAFEAYALAAAVEALEGGGDCAAALRAAEAALSEGIKAERPMYAALAASPGFWEAFRGQTARFDKPLRERTLVERSSTLQWTLDDPDCEDDDCRFVMVRCTRERGCEAFPEAQHYDKMVPLPFGEYLPLADTFPWLRDVIEGPGNFRAGTDPVVFEVEGLRFATPICYEGIIGSLCRRFEGAQLLVNVTNDAWFGPTAASDLHGMLVASRAMELGIPVFRSAYAGVSMVVEPHGEIRDKTALFSEVNRPVEVRLGRADTLVARFGDWFVVVCGILLVVLWFGRRQPDTP